MPVVYTSQPNEGDESGLDIGQMFAALRRRSLVIASITIAVAFTAIVQALTSTPIYEAKFELLIEPLTVENKLTSSPLGEEKQSSTVGETELKVLQSPKLISPIVKQIHARYPGSGSLNLNFNIIKQSNILEISYQNSNPEKVKFVLDLVSKAYLVYSLENRRADVRQCIQVVEEQLPQLQQRVETL